MTERKMATIRKIAEIQAIPEADKICAYRVDGWWVVEVVGKYVVGDLVVYAEPDSWIPTEMAPFLSKGHEPRVYNGIKGEKLKTVRLRGQLSQGLLFPISILDFDPFYRTEIRVMQATPGIQPNADVSEILNIQKYEAPIPSELAGQAAGNFPSFIQKTDQERCQNLYERIFLDNANSHYEITTKLDGTSFTGFRVDTEDGVCSRNWELKLDGANENNSMVRLFIDSGLRQALHNLGVNYAVQGELMGPGIQKNREGLKMAKLFVFDIFDIDNRCYLPPAKRREVLDELYIFGLKKDLVQHVPIIAYDANLYDTLGITTTDQLLKFAEGPSLVHPIREGLVFKRVDGGFSFKAISNAFLLKEKD